MKKIQNKFECQKNATEEICKNASVEKNFSFKTCIKRKSGQKIFVKKNWFSIKKNRLEKMQAKKSS